MDKHQIVQELRQQLAEQEQTMRRAAEAAREAATHEQAKPENDKDTRALEASYLSGAQAAKAVELKAAQNALAFMVLRACSEVQLGALARVNGKWYFVASHGGGMKAQGATVVTPVSALGAALMGKKVGDSVEMNGRELQIEDVA